MDGTYNDGVTYGALIGGGVGEGEGSACSLCGGESACDLVAVQTHFLHKPKLIPCYDLHPAWVCVIITPHAVALSDSATHRARARGGCVKIATSAVYSQHNLDLGFMERI